MDFSIDSDCLFGNVGGRSNIKMKSKADLFQERRRYVNENFGREVEGKKVTRAKQSSILRRLWKEAKRRFK